MAATTRYILGLGNYAQSDDGIGLRVIERLDESEPLEGVEAIEIGNNGLAVLSYFTEETERILVVDCARMDREPGDYAVFGPDDVKTRKIPGNISTHEGDILKLIEMGRQAGCPLPDIRILAIEPETTEPGMELSAPLAEQLDTYVRTAINEITR